MVDLGLSPFFVALALLAGLALVEIIFMLVGLTLVGDADPGLDVMTEGADGFDIDTEVVAPAKIDAMISGFESDIADVGLEDPSGSVMDVTPKGNVPFIIRFAAFLFSFGVSGLVGQEVLRFIFGAVLSWEIAAALAIIPAAIFTKAFSRSILEIMPHTETSATRYQFLGGLAGVVTQGTARRGSPAEVSIRDRHGNTHFLRCEPLRDEDIIPEGIDVITFRKRIPPEYRIRADGTDDWAILIAPRFKK